MEVELIKQQIFTIRGHKVMLDFNLASLYQVETRVLKQSVKRNAFRFPSDFMFQLSKIEWQEVITNCDNLPETIKFSPSTPFAFTEHGVAMLSSVLKSKTAIEVNIAVMRTFVVIRQHLNNYKELADKIASLEEDMNIKFKDMNQALHFLLKKDEQNTTQQQRRRIGFKRDD
jgi:hypothetical protein